MTIHSWNITAPAWYVLDQLPQRMQAALGADWTTRQINVQSLHFMDADGRDYRMSIKKVNEQMSGGELFSMLNRARNESVALVGLSLDVHIMD